MEAPKAQYQHFVPQFILKSFVHPFVCPHTSKNSAKCKKRHHEKGKHPGDPVVNCLQLFPDGFEIEEHSIRRVCGINDMYTDRSSITDFPGQLEMKFSQLECSASAIIRKIIKTHERGGKDVRLSRTQSHVLRKFLFLLAIRGSGFFQRYNCETIEDYNHEDQALLKEFMERHTIKRPIDVWLSGLAAIIDLKMDAGNAWRNAICTTAYFPIAQHFVDHITEFWIALCTPENVEEEFVLTDTGYNVHEGPTIAFEDEKTGQIISLGARFHYFAPIAPRLMVVLRSHHLPEPLGDSDPVNKASRELNRQLFIDTAHGPGAKSIMEDLPVHKAFNSYSRVVDGRLVPLPGWDEQYRMDDRFTFPIFRTSSNYIQKMNGLLLDNAFHGSTIIFNQRDVFLNLLEWYLTEPCEVGKNLTGEHSETKRRYIQQLATFMGTQGREVSVKMRYWPARRGLDTKRFGEANLAAARWLQSLAENDKDGPKPTDKQSEPTDKQSEPTDKQLEPTDKQSEPTDKQSEPTDKQLEPTDKQLEPTDKQSEPTDKQLEPSDKQSEHTSAHEAHIELEGHLRNTSEEPERMPEELEPLLEELTNYDNSLRLECYLKEDPFVGIMYETILERVAASQSITGTPLSFDTGESEHSLALFRLWCLSAALDRRDDIERDDRLVNLLQKFQEREPNLMFLYFLKRIRHALYQEEQAVASTGNSFSMDEKHVHGPEDDIEERFLDFPVISNVAMWKAMIQDISKTQKLNRELTPQELTSLFMRKKNRAPGSETTQGIDTTKENRAAKGNDTTQMSFESCSTPTVEGREDDQTTVQQNVDLSALYLLLAIMVTMLSIFIMCVWTVVRVLQYILPVEDAWDVKIIHEIRFWFRYLFFSLR